MRKPSHADAELLIRLFEMRRDPELRKARAWFLTEFKPTTWADIKSHYLSFDDGDRWFRMTTSYWELVGTLVNRGVLHAELFFDHTGEDIVTWERCKSWVAGARADLRPTYLYQFERLVADHLAFRKRTVAAYLAAEAKAATKATRAGATGGRAKKSRASGRR